MDKQSRLLFLLFILFLVIVVCATFYKSVVLQDFEVVQEETPEEETELLE